MTSTITERREALGLSKRRLAELAEISRPTIITVERDGRGRAGTIEKLEAALDKAERERQEAIDRYGLDAHNNVARLIGDLEDLLDRGAISPGGVVVAMRGMVDAYADHLEKIDPRAVSEAVEVTTGVVKGKMRARSERN